MGGRGWTELVKETAGFCSYLAPTSATLFSATIDDCDLISLETDTAEMGAIPCGILVFCSRWLTLQFSAWERTIRP